MRKIKWIPFIPLFIFLFVFLQINCVVISLKYRIQLHNHIDGCANILYDIISMC